MYGIASAFFEIIRLADLHFVSIATTRPINSVAGIAGKARVTASTAAREAGFSAEKITVRRALPVTLQLIVPYAMLSKISTTSKNSFSTVLQISSPGTGTSLRQVLPQYLQPAGKEIR